MAEDREKLIRSKQAWAQSGRLLTGRPDAGRVNRLPPGQRETMNWPVLDLGVQPHVPLADWVLAIDGLVENPVTWRWSDFIGQPQVEMVSDIHCVTAWSRYDNRWSGVASSHLLALVRPKAEARHVVFTSYDGYTTNVAVSVFAEPNVLIASHWEGAPLTREHGGPARLIIPDWYFWKSAKWVNRITFLAADAPGFWEVRGYHNEGDPWREQRYSGDA